MTGAPSPGPTNLRIRLQAWLATPTWRLLRFLAAVTALCVIACLYFWQVSTIASMRSETARLQRDAAALERANAALMLQVAAWDRPDHIQAEATGRGLVPAKEVLFVEAPALGTQVAPPAQPNNLANWWQRLWDPLRSRWPVSHETSTGIAQAGK